MLDIVAAWREKLRPPTLLYGMPLRGVGTEEREALPSHLLRVAHEHRLTPGEVTQLVHDNVLTDADRMTLGGRHGRVAQAELVNHLRTSSVWVSGLERATGVPALRLATLAPLLHSFGYTNLTSKVPRVCVQCCQEDLESTGESYGRLIWWVASVRCCHKHGTRLVEIPRTSPRGSLSRRLQLYGVCMNCGRKGYRCSCVEPPVKPVLAHDRFVAREVATLIGSFESIDGMSLEAAKNLVKARVTEEWGAITRLTVATGFSSALLSGWINNPDQRMSIERFVVLARALGVSSLPLLQGSVEDLQLSTIAAPGLHKRRKTITGIQVRTALRKGLALTLSLTEVARELGISTVRIRNVEPELSDAVQRNFELGASKRRVDTLKAYIDRAAGVAMEMVRRGLPISHQSARLLGLRGEGSFYAGQALERMRREMGISGQKTKLVRFASGWEAEFDAAVAVLRGEAAKLGRLHLVYPHDDRVAPAT